MKGGREARLTDWGDWGIWTFGISSVGDGWMEEKKVERGSVVLPV